MRSDFHKIVLLVAWLAAAASAWPQSAPPAAPSPEKAAPAPSAAASAPAAKPAPEYVIGIDDILAINVWKEPELSRALQVRPDGKITLPLIGEIEAAGKTPTALKEVITQGLTNYVAHPEVTVIVQEVHSQKFNIVGQVAHSGTFVLTKPMTVLDGLALAGGFSTFAKLGDIYVLRVAPDGRRMRLPFNYKKVIKGQNPEQNIELETRDTIVVP